MLANFGLFNCWPLLLLLPLLAQLQGKCSLDPFALGLHLIK